MLLSKIFHFHSWIYKTSTERTCKKCGKQQVYINEGPVSGMADLEGWVDVYRGT